MNSAQSSASRLHSNATNENMAAVINLGDYVPEGEKVISGREQGYDIRQQSRIDELIGELSGFEKVTVELPEQIRSISPAFLEEFLGEAVRSYGRSGFMERVAFTQAKRYDVTDDLEEAIDRIITEKNALAY